MGALALLAALLCYCAGQAALMVSFPFLVVLFVFLFVFTGCCASADAALVAS